MEGEGLYTCTGVSWFTSTSQDNEFVAQRCFSFDSARATLDDASSSPTAGNSAHCVRDATVADLNVLLEKPGVLVLFHMEFSK